MYKILLVEDDAAISAMLNTFLTSQSYHVTIADRGKKVLHAIEQFSPDILLLDWMLPDLQGPQIIARVRSSENYNRLPIIMLTAKGEESDKIKGFSSGADDYLTKPISLYELNARIQALLRRTQQLNQHLNIVRGPICLTPDNQLMTINDEVVNIGNTEYRLLHFFMKNTNRLYTRSQLLDQVWGLTTYIDERTVDVNIMRLRKILKAHGVNEMLKTIHGSGYLFECKSNA